MATQILDSYTLEQAEQDIATIRGQLQILPEVMARSDVTSRTVTSTATTQLSGSFNIPANDANTGTIYRLSCGGQGTWGTTAEQANFDFQAGGASAQTMGIASGTFATGTSVMWEYRQYLIVTATGTSGTYCNQMWCSIGASSVGAQVNGPNLSRNGTANAINTTVANTYQVNFFWTAGPAGSTITCNWSLFERLGL